MPLPRRTFETVTLASVDFDDVAFDFSSHQPAPRPAPRALHPPALRPRGERRQIVAGRPVLEALRADGASEVEAFLLEPDADDLACVECALSDIVAVRELDALEKAKFVRRLLELLPEETVRRDYCAALGVAPAAEALERARAPLALAPELQALLADDRLAEKPIGLLTELTAEEQRLLARVIETCRLGVNLQRELIENLDDVARRDGKSVGDVLDTPMVHAVLDDSEHGAADKAQGLRAYIHRLRYPQFSQREAEFDKAATELAWPPELKLAHHPAFEDSRLRVELTFRTRAELLDRLAQLEKLRDPELLKRLGVE